MDTRSGLTRLTNTGNGSGSGECNQNDCPNVYRTERGTFVIQGATSGAFTPPRGEGLVEIPESVLREAVRALGW
ncbi:hypothetical protein BX285_1493 [Streptomyces sp. 1114.5]|uniref:hypothetical protein n=1 Tax=unclassified Streptomyces TaxID=2593676 RepID=UPI000BCE0929|nr:MULTISPECIES: hypothetical protein [unclassified Streptomyces]RKT17129.1 hypothetical protein BX285_1493 [Streptomyces sp. 1114.5]SOB83338.1 hypothetical protein SAMN06272789_3542 [Streptomyces sp. 1331.2]